VIVDAGNVPVAGGGTIRSAAVFRLSGGLAGPDELARLDAARLRCVVDLRGPDEDRSAIQGWAAARGVQYVAQPIPAGDRGGIAALIRAAVSEREALDELDRIYRRIVDDYGAQLAGTIAALVGHDAAGYGCAAGKDRTGVVTALLHVLLGVSEEDAVRAYVSGAPAPERLHGLIRTYLELGDDDPLPVAALVMTGTRPDTMRATLAHVRETYGDVEAYLREHGLPAGAADELRRRLVSANGH